MQVKELAVHHDLGASGDLVGVLIGLTMITCAARGLGSVFGRIGQPAVIGEIFAGILLGPSLLGRLAPAWSGHIFTAQAMPVIGLLAQIGVILYMFEVGRELDPYVFQRRGMATLAISHASIVIPFLLGSLLSIWLYPRYALPEVGYRDFILFTGVAMSITAFPVLARILSDRGMTKTSIGELALACAAIDDVTAWCLLALMVGVAGTRMTSALRTLEWVVVYIAFLFLAVGPILRRLHKVAEQKPQIVGKLTALVYLMLVLAVCGSENIGIHGVFGAFLFGLLLPQGFPLPKEVTRPIHFIVAMILMPAYLAFTGMRTRIDLLNDGRAWAACGLIVMVAALGKFGGSSVAARLAGVSWRDAARLGALMNTRGLMEFVVLNIGLDLGIITPKLFTMFVMMALLTTLATAPTLKLLERGPLREPGG